MKLVTQRLRRQLLGFGLRKDSSDEETMILTRQLLQSGALDPGVVVGWMTDTPDDEPTAQVERHEAALSFTRGAVKESHSEADALSRTAERVAERYTGRLKDTVDEDPGMILARGSKNYRPDEEEMNNQFARDNGKERNDMTSTIDVKRPGEIYSGDRRVAKHRRTGEPVVFRGQPLTIPSERDLATKCALLQYVFARGDESKLRRRAFEMAEDFFRTSEDGPRLKSLLSNSGSGGSYWNLDVLSDEIFTNALLSGELLPFVTIEDMPEGVGPAVRSPIMGPVTLQKSTGEGTSADLFDATGFLSTLPITLYPWQIHIDVGLDFLRDTPLDVMNKVREKIADTFAAEIDNDIAIGAGTAGPLGLFNSSGTTIVSQSSPSPTGWDVNDIENMMRALPRQYRKASGAAIRWVSTDTTYFRIRGVSVSTSDQRRVFGMDHGAYSVFDYPWSVNESIGNANLALVDLRYYHLLRTPLGFKYTDQGATLQRANLGLLSARCRLGGRLMLGQAMAEMNSGPA